MIIKNILINNKEIFLDCLIKELILNNISYVLIDNYEIHFNNYIIRLYTKEELINSYKNLIIINQNENKPIIDINSLTLPNQEEYIDQELKPYIKKDTPKLTKKMIKQQNRYYQNKINRNKII